MSDASSLPSLYLDGLQTLLPPPAPATERKGEAVRPPAPFDAQAFENAQRFLEQSQSLQADLAARWQAALDDFERSKIEVQMLAAAAADFAIAERLAFGAGELAEEERPRSDTTGGAEALIQQALTAPEQLLAPVALPEGFRDAAGSDVLLEAVWNCLEAVRKGAASSTKDTLADLLTMRAAVLREAAELLGADLQRVIGESSSGMLKTALDYVVSGIAKLRLVIGPEGEADLKQAILDFIDKLKDEELIGNSVKKFLHTDEIHKEARLWVKGYAGDPQVLTAAAQKVAGLQGSFQGRIKIADVVVKGLTVAKLIGPLTVPPWGPLAIASAHLLVVGYVLYSAYDHVDSDRYKFLDRVQGVRGVLVADLGIPRSV